MPADGADSLWPAAAAVLFRAMAQKKGSEVDNWLSRPDPGMAVVLLYGPDRGLVAERARAFAAATGLSLDDPFSVVRLDAGEIEAGRLLDEARTVPMFSARRLLWIRNASAQKSIADDVKALCAEPPADAVVLIEAADLKKGSPLRSAVEAARVGMALPCYADEGRDIDSVIDGELQKAGMRLSLEARALLRRNLGGDRLASRGEIQKLALYAHGKAQIDVEDVAALTGDVSGAGVDEAVDAVIEGRVDGFDTAFVRQSQTAGQAYLVLAAALRQFQAIQLMRSSLEQGGRNAASVVASARPPVFYARKKTMEKAIEHWTGEALQRTLARLQTAVLATRKRPDLAVAIARQALLGTTVEAARLGRR